MKVIFMGTPEFSCVTLQKLIDDPQMEVVAVYTKEPQISGRGQKINNSAVHNLALKNNLKVLTPKTLKNIEIQKEFLDFKADMAVVVAYGLILPATILGGTKFGCVNIHPSLLPKWRGAAPIQRTIMDGDLKSGITIIKMDQGIDSGEMIYQEEFILSKEIDYQELSAKFAVMGAEILLNVLKKIAVNDYKLTKQDEKLATYAKKISKDEAKIDWEKSAKEINCLIRALSGNIGAYFIYKNERIKILKAEILEQPDTKIGEISDQFTISCKDGIIKPLILQREGKNKMPIEEFLRGFIKEI